MKEQKKKKRLNKTHVIAVTLLVVGITITLVSIFAKKKKDDDLIIKSANNTEDSTTNVMDATDITPLITQVVKENVTETKVDTITVDDETGELVIDEKNEAVDIIEDKDGNKIATIKTEGGDIKVAVKTNEDGKVVVDNSKTIVTDDETGTVVAKNTDDTPGTNEADTDNPLPTQAVETTVKVDDEGNVVIEKRETTVTTVTVMPTATDIPKDTPTKKTEIKEALTPTPRATNTPTPKTNTPTPIETAKTTDTPTPKPSVTETPTTRLTETPTPTSVAVPTSTTKPTNTPKPTSVSTNTPTPTQKPTNTPTPTKKPTTAACSHSKATKQYYTRDVPAYDEPITEARNHMICKLCGVDAQEFIDAYNKKDAKKLNELYLVDTDLVGHYLKDNIEKNPNYLLENFSKGSSVFTAHCGGSWYEITTLDTVGYKHHDGWTVKVYKGTYCAECDTWIEKYYIEDTCPEHPERWLTDDFVNDWNYQMGTNYTKQDLYIKMYIYKEKM